MIIYFLFFWHYTHDTTVNRKSQIEDRSNLAYVLQSAHGITYGGRGAVLES